LTVLVAWISTQSKKSLQKANNDLNKLLDSFDDNVIASKSDLKGNIIYASKEFARITGYRVDELVGKPHSTVRHPDTQKDIFKMLWKTIQSGQTWKGELKNLKKNGGFYWVDAVITPEFDNQGNITGYSAIRHDITAKKEVEELSKNLELKVEERTYELQKTQEQFSSMASNVPGVIYRCKIDENWTMMYISSEIEKLSGYPVSDFINNNTRSFADIMFDEDIAPVAELIQERIDNGKKFLADYRIVDKQGVIKWVRSQGQETKDSEGNSWLDGVLYDVTEQRALEQQIKENQEQMTYVSEFANLGFWNFNPQVGDLFVNDIFVKMLGYNEKEVLSGGHENDMFKPFKDGLSFWEQLLHPEDIERTTNILNAHINGETDLYKVEYRMRRADGSWMWSLAVGKIAEFDDEGRAVRFNGVNLDIQDAKDAQEKIHQNKLFLDALLDSQEQIVITTDGYSLRSANQRFMDFFHVEDVSEFIQENDCICDKFKLDDTNTYLQKYMGEISWIDYVILHEKTTHKAIISKDGKDRIFSVTAAVMPISNGQIKSAVFTEITELEIQKKQTDAILSSVLLPMLITSKESKKIVYANSFAESQYETTIDQLMGLDIETFYTYKAQRDDILNEMIQKGSVQNFETKFKTMKGNEFDALLSLVDISFGGEECFLGVASDISEQKSREVEIHKLHKHTQESIEYASLIQHALIPSNDLFRKYFSDYLTIWHPKDIVGGDIYLFEELRNENECLLMVIDCTGHGVPGAFVTMLVKAIERQITSNIINSNEEVSPAKILSIFNRSMKHLLKQEDDESISNAGFDGGILYYNKEKQIIKFSGAETPLFYMEDEVLHTIKGSRHSVGYKKSNADFEFEEHTMRVKEGMQFYLTTDGYIDQNGGVKGFPFGKKRFSKIIEDTHMLPFADQQEVLLYDMMEYQGDEERNDDVTVVGIKIKE